MNELFYLVQRFAPEKFRGKTDEEKREYIFKYKDRVPDYLLRQVTAQREGY